MPDHDVRCSLLAGADADVEDMSLQLCEAS